MTCKKNWIDIIIEDNNKKISIGKIGASVLKGQAAFWGVSKVPYLNSAVNLVASMMVDYKSLFDAYKVDRKDSDKIKRNRDTASKAMNKLAEEEQALTTMVSGMRQFIHVLTTNYVSIMALDPNAFSTQPGYTVTKKIIKAIDPTLMASLSEKKYFKLKPNVMPKPVEKAYNTAMTECKKNEDKIFQQMQKIAALSRDVKKSNDEIDSIVNDFKNRKK